MKKIICFVLFLFILMYSNSGNRSMTPFKNNDLKNIKYFLTELMGGKYTGQELYNKFFFINEPGQPDRSKEEIKYYCDTLFKEMATSIKPNEYEVLSLSHARKKYGKDNFYNYYYDGQKNSIYVIIIKAKVDPEAYHCLMYMGKIVSLEPDKILDGAIISWR